MPAAEIRKVAICSSNLQTQNSGNCLQGDGKEGVDGSSPSEGFGALAGLSGPQVPSGLGAGRGVIVRYTDRGRAGVAIARKRMLALERDYAARVGADRWAEVRSTLETLFGDDPRED